MCIYHKKLFAFTISELVVAMLISSIAISLAIFSFLGISKQVHRYQMSVSKQDQIQQFYTALSHDFYKSDSIYLNNNYLELISEKDYVRYQISSVCSRNIGNHQSNYEIEATSSVYEYNSERMKETIYIILQQKDTLYLTKDIAHAPIVIKDYAHTRK